MKSKTRCPWAGTDPLMIAYHDKEWGLAVDDDRRHFEFLVLEAAQAGLSWAVVLKKREGFRKAFSQFDPKKVALYDEQKIEALLLNPEIIRNRLKVQSSVNNAQRFLEVQAEFSSFDTYCWQFVGGKPLQSQHQVPAEVPATSPESDAFSKDLKKRGFKFMGSTVAYAYMQAVGMVNDHLLSCFRHQEVQQRTK